VTYNSHKSTSGATKFLHYEQGGEVDWGGGVSRVQSLQREGEGLERGPLLGAKGSPFTRNLHGKKESPNP